MGASKEVLAKPKSIKDSLSPRTESVLASQSFRKPSHGDGSQSLAITWGSNTLPHCSKFLRHVLAPASGRWDGGGVNRSTEPTVITVSAS